MLVAKTLRAFGGSLANAPIYSYEPRRGRSISRQTLASFEACGVHHIARELNRKHADYGLANKVYACAEAEATLDYDIVAWCDSDMLILNPPEALVLSDHEDVAVRPVSIKNVGTCGPGDTNHEYWSTLYDRLGVKQIDYVTTIVSRDRIYAYWNSGLVAARRTSRLFARNLENFESSMSAGIVPPEPVYAEQSILAATISAARLRVKILPLEYNYPIRAHVRMTEDRVEEFDRLVTAHYHDMFDGKTTNPLPESFQRSRKKQVLEELLSETGVFRPQTQQGPNAVSVAQRAV